MASCPECEYDEIDTEEYEDGDILSCPECGKSLVMAGSELEVADDDDLDDDDDDLDEEDDEDGLDDDDDDEEAEEDEDLDD